DRDQSEWFSCHRVRVCFPKKPNVVGFDQSVDAWWPCTKFSLEFLDCTHVLLAPEYQLLFLHTLGLHLVGRYRDRNQNRCCSEEKDQSGEGKSSLPVRRGVHCLASGRI